MVSIKTNTIKTIALKAITRKTIALKAISLNKKQVLALTQFCLLFGISCLAPLLKSQALTGPVVNASLFVSVVLLGPTAGIMLGLLPSLIALSTGLLPALLAPAVPFIMAANAILIVTFEFLRPKNFFLAVMAASFLKFLFLFSANSIIANLLLKKELVPKVAQMLSWPQLLTALTGGLIAFLILKTLPKA